PARRTRSRWPAPRTPPAARTPSADEDVAGGRVGEPALVGDDVVLGAVAGGDVVLGRKHDQVGLAGDLMNRLGFALGDQRAERVRHAGAFCRSGVHRALLLHRTETIVGTIYHLRQVGANLKLSTGFHPEMSLITGAGTAALCVPSRGAVSAARVMRTLARNRP